MLNYSVYVGPYIKVTHAHSVTMDELLDGFEHIVQDGRYEAADNKERNSGTMYFIPVDAVPGIDRKMTFSNENGYDVVKIFDGGTYCLIPAEELFEFSKFVMPFYMSLQGNGISSVSTCWGVVPCWR